MSAYLGVCADLGILVLIDNWRILVGRNAYKPDSGKRRFRAAFLDNDEWFNCINPIELGTSVSSDKGDGPIGIPYSAQVWRLAGLDPKDRPERGPVRPTMNSTPAERGSNTNRVQPARPEGVPRGKSWGAMGARPFSARDTNASITANITQI